MCKMPVIMLNSLCRKLSDMLMEIMVRFYYHYHDVQPGVSPLLSTLRFLVASVIELSSKTVMFSKGAREYE